LVRGLPTGDTAPDRKSDRGGYEAGRDADEGGEGFRFHTG
jgi:hypothetical protein